MQIDEAILKLISENTGDLTRLREMLVRMRSGKELYKSDIAYVEKYSNISIDKPEVDIVETYIWNEIPKKKRKRPYIFAAIIISLCIILIFSASQIDEIGVYFHYYIIEPIKLMIPENFDPYCDLFGCLDNWEW